MSISYCIVENKNVAESPSVRGPLAEKRRSVYDRLGNTLVATADIAKGQVIDAIKLHAVENPETGKPYFESLEKLEEYVHPGGDDYLVRQPNDPGFVLFDADRNQAGTFFNEIPLLDAKEREALEKKGKCKLDLAHLKSAELQDAYETPGGMFMNLVALRDIKKNEEIYGCYRKGEKRDYRSGCEGVSISDALELSEDEEEDAGGEVSSGTREKPIVLT